VLQSVSKENLGVSEKFHPLFFPLGATINMDGTALYQGYVLNIPGLKFMNRINCCTQMFRLFLLLHLGSIGTAGVPGAGL
jgi:Na+/H+-dicarboxylate symporter